MAIRGKHVLIVDDYADALDVWSIYLKAMGCHVSTAADGQSAVALAERVLPDVIVLDLELPGISGFEAARRLRRNPLTHDIPLIAATGYSHARQITMAYEAGFDRVTVKPLDPDVLVEEIERLLDSDFSLSQPSHSAVEQAHKNG